MQQCTAFYSLYIANPSLLLRVFAPVDPCRSHDALQILKLLHRADKHVHRAAFRFLRALCRQRCPWQIALCIYMSFILHVVLQVLVKMMSEIFERSMSVWTGG